MSNMIANIHRWLATGERGQSSDALAFHFLGGSQKNNHPYDPADLNRCVKFLDAVPGTRERIGEMAGRSPTWARLVSRWADLERLLAEEIAEGTGEAPRTYELMQELRKEPTR